MLKLRFNWTHLYQKYLRKDMLSELFDCSKIILLFLRKWQTFLLKRIRYYIFDSQNFAPIVWFFGNFITNTLLSSTYFCVHGYNCHAPLFDSSVIVSLTFAQSICYWLALMLQYCLILIKGYCFRLQMTKGLLEEATGYTVTHFEAW